MITAIRKSLNGGIHVRGPIARVDITWIPDAYEFDENHTDSPVSVLSRPECPEEENVTSAAARYRHMAERPGETGSSLASPRRPFPGRGQSSGTFSPPVIRHYCWRSQDDRWYGIEYYELKKAVNMLLIATATEMQKNFGAYLNLIMAGQEVIVTKNGKSVGRLVPDNMAGLCPADSPGGILEEGRGPDKTGSED